MDLKDQIIACIQNTGFNGVQEFEVYKKCSTITTTPNQQFTNYQTVSNVKECFLKQIPNLSKFVFSACIPEKLQKRFLSCMGIAEETFLTFVDQTFKKATLFFDEDTLGQAFHRTNAVIE